MSLSDLRRVVHVSFHDVGMSCYRSALVLMVVMVCEADSENQGILSK